MKPETLKAWRARLSLGEAGMSAYLGVPVTTYRKWENGTRKPDAAPLRLFAVLAMIEASAPEVHHVLMRELPTASENKPTKARKPRAATQAPATPEKRPSGSGFVPVPPEIVGAIVQGLDQIPVVKIPDIQWDGAPVTEAPPPWIHAADALPAWMKGGV